MSSSSVRPLSSSKADFQAEPQEEGCCELILKIICYIFVVLTFPFSLCTCIKIIKEYERAVIFRLGRALPGAKGPGMFFILSCIDSIVVVDLRTETFDVPPQEILTKDSVTVRMDAVVYYRVFDPFMSVVNVEDAGKATRLLASTTLRNIMGSKSLTEILAHRDEVTTAMQELLDSGTDPWGIKVERVEIKDVRLPVQLQRAMAAEAEASREARAKVIAAEGEQTASRALKEAADVINQSESALQLRFLQTLTQVASEKNHTITFPLDVGMMKALISKMK